MKKALLFCIIAIFILPLSAQEQKVKTGWKFGGALPAISFDSDLGFQYGALFEIHNYGDGSKYPEYFDRTYTEISRYTRGSGIYRFMYESYRIIPGVHWTSDLSYLPDQASHFYGFNGYESVFNKPWMEQEDPDYKTRMFYRFERNQFRFKNDFDGRLAGENWRWNAGFAFNNFYVDTVDIPRLNKGQKAENKLPYNNEVPGLFELYKQWDIVPQDEWDGGWVNTIKAGITWDSRDNRYNPMKGIWTEAGLEIAPGFIGNDWSFSKFYFTHRQYFTIVENNLAFVYRLGYQTTLWGHAPFFYQSQLITSLLTGATSEGLGGFSSLRGVLKNRVTGDGFAYGNFELRWKPLHFSFLKQPMYIGLNAFYDIGRVTDRIDYTIPPVFPTQSSLHQFFSQDGEKFHHSAGISIMPVWHENFIIAVDIGKAFNEQDGNIGFAIGLNYLF